jgi:hypothetical protein
MPEQQGQIRRNVTQAAKRSRPYGEREETRYPVHATGASDIDLHYGQEFRDQTDDLILGEMTT